MASKQRYTATIELGDGKDILSVDMLNLPYDMFGPEFPLEITGPVDMGKCKGQPLPDMTNVVIYGEFDCSTCTINADTVLPKEISKLVCKHSINNLDTLIGILPLSLQQVVVRPAIINAVKDSIKKNSTDDIAYKSAIKFMETYPDITVTDGKKTLAEIIQDHSQTATKKESKKTKIVNAVPQLEQQTEDWLSVNDLIPVCEELLGPDLLARLDKDLKRYIRQALSAKSTVKVETREMQRTDGTKVKCIRKEDANLVAEQIAESVQSQDKAEAKGTKKPVLKKTAETKAPTEPQKYYIGNREIHPIKIKKYISKAAWGQILSKVGKNTTALREILQDIENINVNPALAHTASGQVAFIKDEAVQVSPTVGFKNGRCLAQGFGTLDDRPRIVWGICGNAFVCQNFYSAHEGKVKQEYNKLLREIDIDISKLDLSEYLLVTNLIKELKVERTTEESLKEEKTEDVTEAIAEQTVAPAPVIETVATPVVDIATTTETTQEKKEEIIMPEQSEIKPKRPRIKRVKCTEETAPKTHYWASLYHLSAQIKADYRATALQQQRLLNALTQPMTTDEMLDYTNELHEVLCHKRNLEWAMQQVEEKNKELFTFIDQIKNEIKR